MLVEGGGGLNMSRIVSGRFWAGALAEVGLRYCVSAMEAGQVLRAGGRVSELWRVPQGMGDGGLCATLSGRGGGRCNGSSDSTQLYTDVIRIPMILRCTLVQ